MGRKQRIAKAVEIEVRAAILPREELTCPVRSVQRGAKAAWKAGPATAESRSGTECAWTFAAETAIVARPRFIRLGRIAKAVAARRPRATVLRVHRKLEAARRRKAETNQKRQVCLLGLLVLGITSTQS
jgi:hypothetical protein